MRWQDKLTKKELAHLRKDGGATTLTNVRTLAAYQKKMRDETPDFGEPCWECREIMQKLGLKV